MRNPHQGTWIAGDFHNHTCLTDGDHPAKQVFSRSFSEFGLGWIVNSEHGGAFQRDPYGRPWTDPAIEPPTVFKGLPAERSKKKAMWRWQSLAEYSYPIIEAARNDPSSRGKLILQGLEFNCPGHEHVSTGILAESGWPLAEFEYRFDAVDGDTSGGPDGRWTGKNPTNDHAKALQAIAWLKQKHATTSWFVVNHPERASKYRVADLREFNDAAPDIAFGFEGAPGHQKATARGEYAAKSYRYADGFGGATCGGVGVFVARVGGAWDAMLAEGRRYYVFANSDFHEPKRDCWPGEYFKNWVKIAGRPTGPAWLEAMRSGRAFFVAGDLIDGLEFTAATGSKRAETGGTLKVKSGDDVQVAIRFRDPVGQNHLGDSPAIHHLDLIAGECRVAQQATAATKPSAEQRDCELNPSTKVVATFDQRHWKASRGWSLLTYTLKGVDRPMYLRLRGTSLAPSTAGETDEQGNPLTDDQAILDTAEEARQDLWFYSNPIFIELN